MSTHEAQSLHLRYGPSVALPTLSSYRYLHKPKARFPVGWLPPLPVREFHPLETPSFAWRAKIGAGQVIEQHFKLGTEQILPALAQMIEQCLLVLQQFVEAAIERMYLHQPIISAQQVSHRALLEPQPVQAPLAAGIDQPVAY